MNPYYSDKWVKIYHGDCRELTFENISAIVTDPPYELGFMGKKWDSQGVSFQKDTWEHLRGQCLSGAPLLSFGGTRTFHRITCAIEDAGWEIRDTIMWVYGSGFPKSLDISKAIDKQFGAERTIIGRWKGTYPDNPDSGGEQKTKGIWTADKGNDFLNITTPATPEAQLWEGYGTALKPAYEPIILAMNPLDGTFAENALKHKVAGLNIDGTRIPAPEGLTKGGCTKYGGIFGSGGEVTNPNGNSKGRFPSNFIHDGSQMVMELFPITEGKDNFRQLYT